MAPLIAALQAMGADITYLAQKGFAPIRISGKNLQASNVIEIDSSKSSQYISALLLIGSQISGGLNLHLSQSRVSNAYIQMTIALLKQAGITVSDHQENLIITEQKILAHTFYIEPDWSSASYWYAIKALGYSGKIFLKGLKKDSVQGDACIAKLMENYGVQVMSIGFLVDQDQAMIWRGPMATQALEQLLRQTNWRELDYLIVDMPPGTGDIQLTLSQRVPMTGAVVVTTPQDIALLDAKKGIKMFEKVGVPILGIVENMAVHVCSQCGHAEHIFGVEGGKKMAQAEGMAYLGALPLSMAIRVQADSGMPSVASEPDGEVAGIYKAVARQLAVKVAARARDFSSKFPTIKVSKDT